MSMQGDPNEQLKKSIWMPRRQWTRLKIAAAEDQLTQGKWIKAQLDRRDRARRDALRKQQHPLSDPGSGAA